MLKIRLQRVGRTHEPSFRLVLTESQNSTKSGKYLENLGNYDARRGEKSEFKADRISYWMSKGAQTSTTVHNLLINKKLITGKKINALPLKKAIKKEVVEEAKKETEVVAEVAPTETAPVEAPVAEAISEETTTA
mgnify:CR=1 FL=1